MTLCQILDQKFIFYYHFQRVQLTQTNVPYLQIYLTYCNIVDCIVDFRNVNSTRINLPILVFHESKCNNSKLNSDCNCKDKLHKPVHLPGPKFFQCLNCQAHIQNIYDKLNDPLTKIYQLRYIFSSFANKLIYTNLCEPII